MKNSYHYMLYVMFYCFVMIDGLQHLVQKIDFHHRIHQSWIF